MRLSTRILAPMALLLLLTAVQAQAQIPRTISFQGVLADASGILLPDGPVTLTLNVYDVANGGTPIFSETQTVTIARGVFNAIIGSSSPGGIPTTVTFDKPYYLGVQVGSAAELAPRTPFTSVPYALNAAVAQRAIRTDTANYALNAGAADTAGSIRGGYVVSLNGQQGAVEILGAGATTVTRSGNQVIIRSTDTSGGGIKRIDNFDGSLVIDPPNGPYVTMFIRESGVQTYHLRDQSVTTPKIADQAVTNIKLAPNSVTTDKIADLTIVTGDIGNNQVTAAKIGTEGAAYGTALMSNGTATPVWMNPILMNIPFAATVASDTVLWSMTNTGNAGAGRFDINNAANSAAALSATTNGVGSAITGTNSATTGTSPAIFGQTNSTSPNAVAVGGTVNSTAPGGFSAGVRGINNGTGGLGIGVWGSQNGSGWGVYGQAPSGIGVIGASTSGYGVYGSSSTGTGIYGTSATGPAGYFQVTSTSSTSNSLTAANAGTGDAFQALQGGTAGRAGFFQISVPTNTSTGLQVITAGTGWGIQARRGVSNIITGNGGILGESSNGPGVVGFSDSSNGMIAASRVNSGLLAIAFGNSTSAIMSQALGTNSVGLTSFALSGSAGSFQTIGGTADAVIIQNGGTGRSLNISQTNAADAATAVNITNAGSGLALAATSTGTGGAATFQISNATNASNVLNVSTNGTGQGIDVQLTNAGSGARGINVNVAGFGTGVFANSANGMALWGIANAMSAAGVLGDNTYGEAVVGRTRGGLGVGAVVGRNDSSGYGVRGFNTMNGIGVLGQGGINGGTAVGGRFEQVNPGSASDALQAVNNGTGWAGAFTTTNTSGKGVHIGTVAASGANALHIDNGTVAVSYDPAWTSGAIVDDAVLVLNAGGNSALPTGAPLVDGTTVWVVNNSGAAAGISNTTVGPYAIAIGRAQQFIYVSSVSGANWVPVQ